MVRWDDVLETSPDVVTRQTDDELVVVLPDQGKFVVLNATGARVLHLSDGARSLREIACLIAEEFDADLERVEHDVVQFATLLLERRVLSVARPSVTQA